MALAYLYLISGLIIILLHHLPAFTTARDDKNSPLEACPVFACGNGVVIQYPFWTQQIDRKPLSSHFCGYPGFNVSCDGKAPVLGLSNDLYRVTKIDYGEKIVRLTYRDPIYEHESCPKAPHGVEIPSSGLFNYTAEDERLSLFYNCSLYPPSSQPMTCLSHKTLRSFAFTVGAVPEFDWSRYCESNSTIPVMGIPGSEAFIEDDYKRWIQEGFELRWRAKEACQSCEGSGGFCGYSAVNTSGSSGQSDFICICRDGHHQPNFCDGKTKAIEPLDTNVSSATTNAVSLVFGIGGGILMAGTAIFCALRRRDAAAYKLVTEKRNKHLETMTSTL